MKKPIQATQSMLNILKQRTGLDSQFQLFEPYERYVDQLISKTIIDSIYVRYRTQITVECRLLIVKSIFLAFLT